MFPIQEIMMVHLTLAGNITVHSHHNQTLATRTNKKKEDRKVSAFAS
jgi:hypothetical protein